MEKLSRRQTVAIRKGVLPMSRGEIEALLAQVDGWQLIEEDGVARLRRTFEFKNFAQAMAFSNRVGQIAEEADHHPVIITEWGRVTLTWWTHAARGLHMNDFILAARCDEHYTETHWSDAGYSSNAIEQPQ